MKKFTLFFAALMACTLSYAQTPERVLDLSQVDKWGFPKEYVNTATTFVNGIDTLFFTPAADGKGIKITLDYSTDTLPCGVIFGKKDAALTMSAYSFEIEKIVVYGVGSASAKTTLNIFAGDKAVSTEVTSSKETHTFLIDKEAQIANTRLTLKVTNANNAQVSKIEIYKKTSAPSISCDNVTMGNVGNGVFNKKNISIIGSNLTEAIIPSMKEGKNFSVTGQLPTEGGKVSITVTATTAGEYKDILILTSGSTTKEVEVTAIVNVLSGRGTQEYPLSVADVQILDNPADTAWVMGYIVGSVDNGAIETTPKQATNIALSDTKTLPENGIFVPVQLPKGNIRTTLNVVDNAENIGKMVKIKGALETYFQMPGIKGASAYEFVAAPTAVENIKAETGKAVKVIEYGQLIIIRDNVRYNAVGAVIE